MPSHSPTKYLADKSTHQTIRLAGRHINLAKLAEGEDLDHGYLSRIMRSEREPSIAYLKRIAAGLGMTIDGLLTAIADAKEERLQEYRDRLI